jgi:O-antigen/teichoic acid export membrane protein
MAAKYLWIKVSRYRRVSWSLVDQAVISGGNFLSTYLLALYLDLPEFGLYTVALAGLLFLNGLQEAIITQPHNVLGAKRNGVVYRHFTADVTIIQILTAVLTSVSITAIGLFMVLIGDTTYGALVIVLGISSAPWMFQEFVRRILYTKSDSFGAVVNDVVSYGLQVVGITSLIALSNSPSKETGILILGGSSAIASILGLWQLRSHTDFSGWNSIRLRETWTEIRTFGQWLVARKLMDWVGRNGHTWLILIILGPVMVGVYNAVSHFVNFLNVMQKAAQTYLPSRGSRIYAEQGLHALRIWLPITQRKVLIPFSIISILLIIFSGQILTIAYGDKFDELSFSWGLEWIIILGVAARWVTVANNPVTIALMALGDTRSLFWTSMLAAVVLATGGVALIHQFSVFGVAFVKVLIALLLFSATGYLYRRRVQIMSEAASGPGIVQQPEHQPS